MDELARLQAAGARFACFISLLEPGSQHSAAHRTAQPVDAEAGFVAVKDCIDIAGVRGTWGSAVHRDRIADQDAFVIAKLRAAGATFVATTNLHEFAFGGTTQNPHYGNCRNAWQENRVPGGSSGGSAVAVALGLCDVALGTDTGASVRMPAALNGVIGFRPTHGSVSSRGVMPVSPPHDTVGLLGPTIASVRRTFDIIRGTDPLDPYSQDPPVPSTYEGVRITTTRLGVAVSLVDSCEPAITNAFERGTLACQKLGATLTDLASPSFVKVADHLSAVVIADAASFHRERLATQPGNVGSAIHTRIARGLSMLAVEYADHLRWLERYTHEVAGIFRDVDFILSPTVPVSPPLIAGCDNAVAVTQMLSRNCWLAPAAGLPAITIPCGIDANGIPVGFQITGPRWSDHALLDLAETVIGAMPDIGKPAAYVGLGIKR